MNHSTTTQSGLKVTGEIPEKYSHILTEEALQFLAGLAEKFETKRHEIFQERKEVQAAINERKLPDFLPDTEHIRNSDWTIASLPEDLQDRRVEITGPVSRKMVIQALNSGAHVFMADFEDATSPKWLNLIDGQKNLYDAVRRDITFENETNGKVYELSEDTATLLVRPRGWHLDENHVLFNGSPISGGLFDFALYMFHNAEELRKRGSGPYFYLPKLEHHWEARLWNEIFVEAQEQLGLPQGTIRATVLIETITAAFEMDEILYELKDHSAGLNCGRWDYIFSYLKRLRHWPEVLLPDRSKVTMTVPFMRAYSLLAIQTCHKRNAPAIGGMAPQIPVKNDEEKNAAALAKVREDKEREVTDGHDGTWVAHPALVPVAKEIFNKHMPQPNQIDKKREDVQVSARDLLQVPKGDITEEGVYMNVDIGLRYIQAWLSGMGAVPIHHLMEDAATAEISRAQLWQWIKHQDAYTSNGKEITETFVLDMVNQASENIAAEYKTAGISTDRLKEAEQLMKELVTEDEFTEFLTLPGYERL
ncbi:malate synthase [Salsuginibacillus halophilus]|uniref:Malate synthase n=1 Tax=Salsuginibacillus halophilus TaxID=517424 RepID=A0A2P8HXD2_9BACI|nr:malate synthase A [Salsuginibacillus halophilus]PSL50867.1 malate synthase [Salsuginibacillus halophilus]